MKHTRAERQMALRVIVHGRRSGMEVIYPVDPPALPEGDFPSLGAYRAAACEADHSSMAAVRRPYADIAEWAVDQRQ